LDLALIGIKDQRFSGRLSVRYVLLVQRASKSFGATCLLEKPGPLGQVKLPQALIYHFYRSYRATLRRLAIAHLAEPQPRTPEKWARLARAYLDTSARDAVSLEATFRTRRGR
jgi:hypothetical protein